MKKDHEFIPYSIVLQRYLIDFRQIKIATVETVHFPQRSEVNQFKFLNQDVVLLHCYLLFMKTLISCPYFMLKTLHTSKH